MNTLCMWMRGGGAMTKTHSVCKPMQCLSPTAFYSLNVACNSKKNINGVTHFNAHSSSGTGHSGWQVFVHSNVKKAPKSDPYDVQHRMLMYHEALFGKMLHGGFNILWIILRLACDVQAEREHFPVRTCFSTYFLLAVSILHLMFKLVWKEIRWTEMSFFFWWWKYADTELLGHSSHGARSAAGFYKPEAMTSSAVIAWI